MINYNPFSLKDKIILITGASSGIGRQCAIDCSRMGASIILIGRNRDRLKETSEQLDGTNHVIISEDIVNFDILSNKISEIISEIGPVNGYIHAAGIEKTQILKNLKPNDYLDIYNTNFVGGINILKVLTKKGNYSPHFKVVFISSITGVIGRVGTLAYTASKGAIISSVRELALELATKGINVNCISPGTIMTPMMENTLSKMSEEDRKKRLDGFPLGVGTPEDISNACIYLLSDASRWITGQNLIIDGGYTAK